MSASAGRLVILSGPSCVGKTPLTRALKRVYPDLAAKLTPLVLYNSRTPRPGEQSGVDFHFRTREQVDTLRAEARYARCSTTLQDKCSMLKITVVQLGRKRRGSLRDGADK